MKTPNQPDSLEEILHKIRWGDYQNPDGSWGYGVANRSEIKALIQTREDRITEALINKARLEELESISYMINQNLGTKHAYEDRISELKSKQKGDI